MSFHIRTLLLVLPLFACGARTGVEDFLAPAGSRSAIGGGPALIGGSGALAVGGSAFGGGSVPGSGGTGTGGGFGAGGSGGGTATFDDSLSVNTLTYTMETIASDNTRIIGLVLEPSYRLRADIYTLPNQAEFEMIALGPVPDPVSPILFRRDVSADHFYVVFTGFDGAGYPAHAIALDASLQWQWATSSEPSTWAQVVDAAVRPSGQLAALTWISQGSQMPRLFEWAPDGSSVTPIDITAGVTNVLDDSRIGTDGLGTVHFLSDGPLSLARRTALGDWLPPTGYAPNLMNCYQCSHLAVSPSGSGYIVAQTWDGYPVIYRYNPDGFMTLLGALDTTDQVLQVLADGENLVVISRGTALPGDPFTVREWTQEGALVRRVLIGAASSVTLKVAAIAPSGRIDLLVHDKFGNFGSPSDVIVSTPAY